MRRWGVVAVSLLLGAVLVACVGGQASMSPELTVERWARALAAQDGNAVAKLTCRSAQADNQTQRLLAMALGTPVPPFGGGAGAFGGGGGGTATFDVTDLAYHTTFVDGDVAKVQVTGFLKMVSGVANQVLRMNSTVGLNREEAQWRVCET